MLPEAGATVVVVVVVVKEGVAPGLGLNKLSKVLVTADVADETVDVTADVADETVDVTAAAADDTVELTPETTEDAAAETVVATLDATAEADVTTSLTITGRNYEKKLLMIPPCTLRSNCSKNASFSYYYLELIG